MFDRPLVELRCSAVRVRGDQVPLLRRRRDGVTDLVLPPAHPRLREGVAAYADREVLEETGVPVDAHAVAFLPEITDPTGERRRGSRWRDPEADS